MAKLYHWLRLKKDFFSSLPMKKLRKIAGGDTFTIIYLKLQLLSLENEGYLYFTGIENNFCEELALALDEESDNIQVTINFLQSVGLVEFDSTKLLLKEVPFLIGKETDKAGKMRKLRERRKKEELEKNKSLEKESECLPDSNIVTSMLPSVTKSYIEIELEKEKEKEIELELEKNIKKINYQEIVDLYNKICVSLPKVKILTESRKKAISARLNIYDIQDFETLFYKAEKSDFLRGSNNHDWKATFDWLIKDSNFAKVLEGNYDKKHKNIKKIDETYEMMANWAKEE